MHTTCQTGLIFICSIVDPSAVEGSTVGKCGSGILGSCKAFRTWKESMDSRQTECEAIVMIVRTSAYG